MNDTLLVCIIERLSNLREPFSHFARAGQRTSLSSLLPQACIERAPCQQAHDDIADRPFSAIVVDGHNMAVLQSRRGLGFAHEARDIIRVLYQMGGHDLDGYFALQRLLIAAVYRAHAANTQQL